jgi:hypothetical protein
MTAVITRGGQRLELDSLFTIQDASPETSLAGQLWREARQQRLDRCRRRAGDLGAGCTPPATSRRCTRTRSAPPCTRCPGGLSSQLLPVPAGAQGCMTGVHIAEGTTEMGAWTVTGDAGGAARVGRRTTRDHCLAPGRVVDQPAQGARYGRMFPDLRSLTVDPEALYEAGAPGGACDASRLPARSGPAVDDAAEAAGWPFFGQFVAHDITATARRSWCTPMSSPCATPGRPG